MPGISGGWTARILGVVDATHFWQRDYNADGPDLVHVQLGRVGDVTLTMDGEALDALLAELTAVRDEWQARP